MNNLGGDDRSSMWNEEDGFFYDVLHLPNGRHVPHEGPLDGRAYSAFCRGDARARSSSTVCPGFKRRMRVVHREPARLCTRIVACMQYHGRGRAAPALARECDQLRRVLQFLLDEEEFLSPYGIRALSRYHKDHPYVLPVMGRDYRVDYEPAESSTGLFGGNSNWRGPIWFPVNYLLIESLQKFHYYLGDQLRWSIRPDRVANPTLWEVAAEFSRRLTHIFLQNAKGTRPVFGDTKRFQDDPHWRNNILFYEYFNGDNGTGIGASHQTGWTGLVAKLIQQSGE